MKHKKLIILITLVLILFLSFLIYTTSYYHAEETAQKIIEQDTEETKIGNISIYKEKFGYFLDSPSEENALIFYGGAKVDEISYIPLLILLAKQNTDVFIIKMPFHLAIFGINHADKIINAYNYKNWYLGGHSLGGAMASIYTKGHEKEISGLILLASYSTKKLPETLNVLSIYGSNDKVLNKTKMLESDKNMPENFIRYEIKGANHAQFGNYGIQKKDGKADISTEEQQLKTAELIKEFISKHDYQ